MNDFRKEFGIGPTRLQPESHRVLRLVRFPREEGIASERKLL
jgi:hypothetical protein